MKKKSLHGGKRAGAGRPKGKPTKVVGQRVPVRFHKQLVKLVKEELKKLLANEVKK